MANKSTNYTVPAECQYSRDAFPSLPSSYKWWTMVPVYQREHLHQNMSAVLQSCCQSAVWHYSNPNPCTAMCNSTSSAETERVNYCLNSQHVEYGSNADESSAVLVAPTTKSTWTLMLVSGLVLSRMLL
ncbi:hypothetical protein NUU61_000818 [Penicillium alfredii]|uniref:Uncharacterized protein n=1 Tax=Penicillium alfredii TaxID=1506179 RepID=A0A9W9GAB2_9EURO|nr:uncharacterized protein NUU61_000818 [Penicillium alfredii]KAJ5115059.1 hypothetical protein NUU61_000818 [Penicillium alfredii]